MMMRLLRWFAILVPASALALAGHAAPQAPSTRPDTISLGRNSLGEPCVAARNWRDPAVGGMFDQSWAITCRNVAASRALGAIRVVDAKNRAAVAKTLECGDPKTVAIKGIGDVPARRCHDAVLGYETVAYEFKRRGKIVIVSAVPSELGPAEEGARIIALAAKPAGDSGRETRSSIDPAALPGAKGGDRADNAAAAFDPAVSLAAGIDLNHKGLHVQASRVLNDALSRLPAQTPPSTRADLLLEAGLADSNIRFFDSATDHLNDAEPLIARIGGDRGGFLARKRDAYRALDLMNRRRFREALVALDKLVSQPVASNEPLQDSAIVRVLNQSGGRRGDVSRSVAVPQTAELAQLTLDAQANWARSVALLALGDLNGAQVALDRAQAAYSPLINERIDPTLVLWLGAQIDRQRGRLQARHKDYPQAIASFDRALAELRRGSLETAGTGTEPTIAETQFEQARIAADQGGDATKIRSRYDAAVDALITANVAGGGLLPVGFERYFDLLASEADGTPRPDTYERFFRAMQAVGEPAVARQLSQLQTVVTADPAVGVKVRDRAELERTITRLRYEIAAGGEGGAASPAELEKQRQGAEAKLQQIDTELSSSQRFRAIDDRPATIDEVRRALHPGELYLKIIALPARAYGMVIAADKTWIYPLALPSAQVEKLALDLRHSIDGRLATDNRLVPFDVIKAHVLFRLITGPATDAVLRATALVIDPAGPLQNLPAGVLVTDRASVDRYEATRKQAPFDFSRVSFLAAHAPISTAVSPRSFLVVRALPPSKAKQPFLGLGEHRPAALGEADGARKISVGFGCQVGYGTLADLSRKLQPIDKHELLIASTALGVRDAPQMTDAAFSDTAVEERKDLADFEVLHFATHGLEEGVWGCSKSPPALVTSFGDKESDGLLSFSEIAQLRLDANLVVLSACDTASGVKDEALARQSGQEEAGSTLEGLVRAFLTANSRAVLATFWPVSADQETDQLIGAFYGSARAKTIGGALQIAQETLIAEPKYSHPFYWGPYFVVGDATKMMLSGPAKTAAISADQVAAR